MLKKECLVSSETIYDGKIITVKQERVLTPSGRETSRELVLHNGGVGIAAVDDSGRICLVRQYRRPFDDFVTEIPAGKLEAGEDVFEAAKRELKEETGYTAENYTYMHYCMSSPGFCSEKVYLYLATGLREGESCPDDDEFLEFFKVPLNEAYEMVMNGEINDGKSVAAILKAREILKNVKLKTES